jgi:hypothetical protein
VTLSSPPYDRRSVPRENRALARERQPFIERLRDQVKIRQDGKRADDE